LSPEAIALPGSHLRETRAACAISPGKNVVDQRAGPVQPNGRALFRRQTTDVGLDPVDGGNAQQAIVHDG